MSKIGKCSNCELIKSCVVCAGCKIVRYCGADCQRAHWQQHRNECDAFREASLRLQHVQSREQLGQAEVQERRRARSTSQRHASIAVATEMCSAQMELHNRNQELRNELEIRQQEYAAEVAQCSLFQSEANGLEATLQRRSECSSETAEQIDSFPSGVLLGDCVANVEFGAVDIRDSPCAVTFDSSNDRWVDMELGKLDGILQDILKSQNAIEAAVAASRFGLDEVQKRLQEFQTNLHAAKTSTSEQILARATIDFAAMVQPVTLFEPKCQDGARVVGTSLFRIMCERAIDLSRNHTWSFRRFCGFIVFIVVVVCRVTSIWGGNNGLVDTFRGTHLSHYDMNSEQQFSHLQVPKASFDTYVHTSCADFAVGSVVVQMSVFLHLARGNLTEKVIAYDLFHLQMDSLTWYMDIVHNDSLNRRQTAADRIPKGTVDCLSGLLRSNLPHRLHVLIVWALLQLSYTDSEHKVDIGDASLIPALLSMLSHVIDLQNESTGFGGGCPETALLHQLLDGVDLNYKTNSIALLQAGGLGVLTKALHSHALNGVFHICDETIIDILNVVVFQESHAQEIVEAGAVKALVDVLNATRGLEMRSNTRLQAVTLLATLSELRALNRFDPDVRRATEMLRWLELHDTNVEVRFNAAAVLVDINALFYGRATFIVGAVFFGICVNFRSRFLDRTT